MEIQTDLKRLRILVIDEWGETQETYGAVSEQDVQSLVDEAEKLNLLCLSGIDTKYDTYFNYAQSVEILEKELVALKSTGRLSLQLLEMIEKGTKTVNEEGSWIYLKVEAMN